MDVFDHMKQQSPAPTVAAAPPQAVGGVSGSTIFGGVLILAAAGAAAWYFTRERDEGETGEYEEETGSDEGWYVLLWEVKGRRSPRIKEVRGPFAAKADATETADDERMMWDRVTVKHFDKHPFE